MNSALHDALRDVLETARSDISAAECHGMLCGMLSAPIPFEQQGWLRHVSGNDDTSQFDSDTARTVIDELVASSAESLDGEEYGFEMLLPDEEEQMQVRVRAFGQWCRGFLSGLGAGGLKDLDTLGTDAREFLRDLEKFTSVADDQVFDEDDARALTELTEFTRMGVMIVRAETELSQDHDSATLH